MKININRGFDSVNHTDQIIAVLKKYYGQHENISQNAFDVEKIRRDFPLISTQSIVWLDNAATTQKPKKMIDRLQTFYYEENANIHRGNYALSQLATDHYELTRKKVADFIGARSSNEIVFVRNTTEAINLVMNTFGKKFIHANDTVLITALEHHSNLLPWQKLCHEVGANLSVIPIDKNGDIELDAYEAMLSSRVKLVAMTHVSNAIGTVLPVKKMIALARQKGIYTLVDGAQAVPHFPVCVSDLDVDFYAFSAHKVFGPTGVGIVYAKESLLQELPVWQVGGGMIKQVTHAHVTYADAPFKFEAGTMDIAGVIAFGATLDYLNTIDRVNAVAYEEKLMKHAIQSLSALPSLKIIGDPKQRVGAVPFYLSGYSDKALGNFLNQKNIALRIGHHCAQPTLALLGHDSLIRPSLAFYNTMHEIDYFVETMHEFLNTLNTRKEGNGN